MAIASGTCGTCTWEISDTGVLTIGAGTLKKPYSIMGNYWPWLENNYNRLITSAIISSGVVVGVGETTYGADGEITLQRFFSDCLNLTSVSFPSNFDTSNVVDFRSMFAGCRSLTSLDLSVFDTRLAKSDGMEYFFGSTVLLTNIILGNNFYIPLETADTTFGIDFNSGENTTNGIAVNGDAAFIKLTNAERAGTWNRINQISFYNVITTRQSNGQDDDDGNDVKITATWSTTATTTIRTLTVYKKLASVSTYPSTPTITQTLSGNSGTTDVTITDVGDDAYDFRVEFYDGTNTYIAFPSVQSNVRLITIDSTGNVCLYLDTTASSGTTDADLYDAIKDLGWVDDVIK